MGFCCCCCAAVPQVHSLLYSPSWDTRTAAAATIGLLAEACPHHSVRHLAAAASAGDQQADAQQQQQLQDLQQGVHITLQTFDLPSVLSKGEPLLASGGQVRLTSVGVTKPACSNLQQQQHSWTTGWCVSRCSTQVPLLLCPAGV